MLSATAVSKLPAVAMVGLSLVPACKSGPTRDAAPAPKASSVQPADGDPCPWLRAAPAGENAHPWRWMDPALTAEALAEVFGQPTTAFSGVAGCSVGLLGAMSVVTFQASMPPPSGWTTPAAADVERTLAVLAKELPGLHVDSRTAAYEVLGETRKEDAELNITIDLVLRRRGTREYLFIRTYAG